jgi:prepilin-type N-terminal cleavage/methylation domain-containing protein
MKLKIRIQYGSRGGFTLFELLVAMAITGIVMCLTGSGLYALMNANQRSQIETTDRLELEQALAFMTDEIKMSQQVMTSITKKSPEMQKFNSASGSSAVQIVLILNPAANSRLKEPIIYYLADPPNDSVWLGPRVIYRWGPTLLQNGNYSDGDGNDVTKIKPNSPVEYFNEVVVDRMSNLVLDKTKTDCGTGYNYFDFNTSAKSTDSSGFYTCIAPDQKSVKLLLNKQSDSSSKSTSLNALVVTRSN